MRGRFLLEVELIDWHRVDELRGEVGAEDFGEVADLFLEEVAEVVARLRKGKAASYAADLHFLKGSALNLGFRKLGTICSDGERLAASGKAETVDIATLVGVYETSIAEFTGRLGKLRAA